jgi:transcription elongation factor GreA
MMTEKIYLTKEKCKDLAVELKDLKTVKRKEVAEQLQYAKGMGDLSENAEYHEARDQQAKIEARISQIENIIKNAEIVNHKKSSTVEVGSEVVIQKKGDKNKQTFTIVGSEEADMSQGKVSNISPLGQAMLGNKKGEIFELKTPKGNTEYKIVSVK